MIPTNHQPCKHGVGTGYRDSYKDLWFNTCSAIDPFALLGRIPRVLIVLSDAGVLSESPTSWQENYTLVYIRLCKNKHKTN